MGKIKTTVYGIMLFEGMNEISTSYSLNIMLNEKWYLVKMIGYFYKLLYASTHPITSKYLM